MPSLKRFVGRIPFRALAALVVGLVAPIPLATSAHPGATDQLDHSIPSQGCGRATDIPLGTSVTRTIQSEGIARSYEMHVPATYRSTTRIPLIVAFHGRKGTGAELEAFSGLSELKAIVLYPNGLAVDGKTAWEGAPYSPASDDVRFVSSILDEVQAELCVNPAKIFATGKSNGGGFTSLLACRLPHRIAAFAAVAGAFYTESEVGCDNAAAVPILEFHGTADTVISYQGGSSNGGTYPAIPTWVNRWADVGHCKKMVRERMEPDVTIQSWLDCSGRVNVTHYAIDGANHTWPGATLPSGPGGVTQTISATAIMWDFFRAHPLRPWAG